MVPPPAPVQTPVQTPPPATPETSGGGTVAGIGSAVGGVLGTATSIMGLVSTVSAGEHAERMRGLENSAKASDANQRLIAIAAQTLGEPTGLEGNEVSNQANGTTQTA